MGRPRKSLWESPAGDVRILASKRGYLMIDERGPKSVETRRKDLADLMAIALQRATEEVPHEREWTFFDLAGDYFDRGMKVCADKSRACSSGWYEDSKGRVRGKYLSVGNTPLSKLPDDFIAKAAMAVRNDPVHNSLSLEIKTIGVGQRIIEYGKQIGRAPRDRIFHGPIQRRVARKTRRDGQRLTVQHHDLPSHGSVHRFAKRFAVHVEAPWMRLFWWLAFYIAFRQGELCALETVDVVERHGRLCIEVVKKVITDATTKEVLIEPYAKGYKHRTVVVPRLLEGPLRARVAEVERSGGRLLFPAWGKGCVERHIDYDTLKNAFVVVGHAHGWEVKKYRKVETYTIASGKLRTAKLRASSLVYTIHDARAFGATAMHHARGGMSLRGMGMRVSKIAEQLGDTEETVKAHYLGIIDDEEAIHDREVL